MCTDDEVELLVTLKYKAFVLVLSKISLRSIQENDRAMTRVCIIIKQNYTTNTIKLEVTEDNLTTWQKIKNKANVQHQTS